MQKELPIQMSRLLGKRIFQQLGYTVQKKLLIPTLSLLELEVNWDTTNDLAYQKKYSDSTLYKW